MTRGMVVIQRVQGLLRARAVQAHLESAGVPVLLDYESAGPVIGLTVDGLGQVRVLVPARLTRRARRVLLEGSDPGYRLCRLRRTVKVRRPHPYRPKDN